MTERIPASARTADEIVAHLKLKPHPEGGFFRETFRDEPGYKGRAHSTAILYLLRAGEVSRWHRVDAAEMWHWYGGAPLLLEIKHGEARHEYRLGSDWLRGEHPHVLVPAGDWQSARSLGAWTLVGCTVASGSTSPASSSLPRIGCPDALGGIVRAFPQVPIPPLDGEVGARCAQAAKR